MLETSHARAQFYGLEEALGKKLKTPEEQAEEIRAVSSMDVARLARSIFKNKKSNLALIGPFTKKDEKKLTSSFAL
jgi:predicted Zn-dependent peptidase